MMNELKKTYSLMLFNRLLDIIKLKRKGKSVFVLTDYESGKYKIFKKICQLLVTFIKINEAAYQLSLLNRNITISQKKYQHSQ